MRRLTGLQSTAGPHPETPSWAFTRPLTLTLALTLGVRCVRCVRHTDNMLSIKYEEVGPSFLNALEKNILHIDAVGLSGASKPSDRSGCVTSVYERRQEKHTCAYSLSDFLCAKAPAGV